MSVFYRLVYTVGFKPWEEWPAEAVDQIRSLLAREEEGREPPYGRALDLGCGTGRWSVELANRGWDVLGIDVVPKAVRAARQRSAEAAVDIRIVEGDVTALRDAGAGSEFRLLLDVECFNHLNDDQRTRLGHEVSEVASPDASLLLLAWARARRGPFPPGATRADLEAAFPAWRIEHEEPYRGALPRPLRNIDPRWYRLTRS